MRIHGEKYQKLEIEQKNEVEKVNINLDTAKYKRLCKFIKISN